MVVLMPRLPAPVAERLLDELLASEPGTRKAPETHNLPDAARFAATGGARATGAQLLGLRDQLVEIARNSGFASEGAKRDSAGFDARAGAMLAEHPLLTSGEALRDDVWAFIGIVLAPDIVNWRFDTARARYLGGVRNAFQRLWMRARVLDRGPQSEDRWELLEQLTEDALVQLTERPSIGADPVLSRHLAEAWLRAARKYGRGKMEPIMRRATLRLRIQNEIRSLPNLQPHEIETHLDGLFDEAASLGFVTEAGDQAATSSSEFDADAPDDASSPSSTRRSSWAIWRAR